MHMHVFSHWEQLQQRFYILVWEPRFEDVINKLDLVQKALGSLVRALKTMAAWKGDAREGCLGGKRLGFFPPLTSKAKLNRWVEVIWPQV